MPKYCFFAQPIENIKTKRVIVYELLLRQWFDDKQLWLRPDDFNLPTETLIEILRVALHELHFPRVSINLTNKQFEDPEVMTAITKFVDENMVPRQLTIELVEKPSFEMLKQMSVHYRAAGILLAFDDVGSDNLYGEIKDMLPYVNTVKFALQNMRKFGEPTPESAVKALQFWFNRAEAHQMLFTFEGIENEEDLALAKRFGISRGQGYYFSKPQLPDSFVRVRSLKD